MVIAVLVLTSLSLIGSGTLQERIDRASAAGGGRVVVPPGRHLVGQVDLRSNVELHLEKGAVLEGKVGLENYRVTELPYSEGTWSAVVSAIGVTNVAITGEGEIFGNGTAWPQPENYGGNQEGRRPRGVFFANCKDVRLRDFTLRDSACWGVVFKCCENVDVRRVKVDSHANANNDGIDVEAKNVVIADCDIDAGDDAVCLKSNNPDFVVENVLVTNVVARSHCNALKLGTASHGTMRNVLFVDCRTEAPRRDFIDHRLGRNRRWYEGNPERIKKAPGARLNEPSGTSAICVENVDGGIVENITYRNIVANGSRTPIFIRAGTRSGRSCGTPPSNKWIFRGVRIENVRGSALSGLTSSVTGVEGCRITNVVFKNVRLCCRGLGDDALRWKDKPVPEAAGGYPDAHMFGHALPAYGLYARHVDGLLLENCSFSLAEGSSDAREPVVMEDVTPHTIMAGDEWIPFVYRKDIVEGSALDFSGLGQLDAPAGKYGWLRANGPDFEFERRPGVVQRFYGANLSGSANFPETPEDAERLATRLARLGYNAVRIHHHDRPCSRLLPDGQVELVPEAMDKLDRFLSECFKRGLYATTDLYVSRPITWRELGIDKPGQAGSASVKAWFYASEAGWTNWCQFARAFMTHRNPYTGRRYADEPALPLVVLVNESCFYRSWAATSVPGMKDRWREWLLSVRAKDPTAYPKADPENPPKRANWWHGGGEFTQMVSSFYAYLEGRFNLRAQRFLREELGVRAMLTGQNHGPYVSPLQEMHETTCDYVDKHFYVDHPSFIGKRWSLPSRLYNKNYVREANNPVDNMGYSRLWSKPFVVSEYNFCGPNEFRAVGGALTGAMAAIQGWGALWRFAYAHTRERIARDSQIPTTFDAASDALGQSSDRVAMMLYLRGDLAPAAEAVAIDLDDAALAPSARCAYEGASWTNLVVWNRRVGTSVRGHAPKDVLRVTAPLQTNAVPPFVVDDRSPVRFDRAVGSFTFDTQRSCGGFSEGGEVCAGALLATVSGAPALVWVTSVDGRALATSRRILLSHLTDVQGEGMQYADESRRVVVRWGNGRPLARRGMAKIRLALEDPQSYEVWAVGTDGSRLEKVPASVDDGVLSFSADTRHGTTAVFHYEIVEK